MSILHSCHGDADVCALIPLLLTSIGVTVLQSRQIIHYNMQKEKENKPQNFMIMLLKSMLGKCIVCHLYCNTCTHDKSSFPIQLGLTSFLTSEDLTLKL